MRARGPQEAVRGQSDRRSCTEKFAAGSGPELVFARAIVRFLPGDENSTCALQAQSINWSKAG